MKLNSYKPIDLENAFTQITSKMEEAEKALGQDIGSPFYGLYFSILAELVYERDYSLRDIRYDDFNIGVMLVGHGQRIQINFFTKLALSRYAEFEKKRVHTKDNQE